MSSSSTALVTEQSKLGYIEFKLDYIEKVMVNFQDRLSRLIAALPVQKEDKELEKAYIMTAALYQTLGHFTNEKYQDLRDSFAYIAECEELATDTRIIAGSLVLSLSYVMDTVSAFGLLALGKKNCDRQIKQSHC